MSFRTKEYLQRYELVRFQLDDVIRTPAGGQHQAKNGYKFTINDRSSFYDWHNFNLIYNYRMMTSYFKKQQQLMMEGLLLTDSYYGSRN